MPPRPIDRAGEDLGAQRANPLGLGVDVLDPEQELPGGPAGSPPAR